MVGTMNDVVLIKPDGVYLYFKRKNSRGCYINSIVALVVANGNSFALDDSKPYY